MESTNLIQIGESVHASIPRPHAAMKELLAAGPGAFEVTSEPLDFIISLINDQIEHRANYLEVNVDAFGEDDQQLSVDMMRDYTRLIRKHSGNVPICIDSSNDDVLKAGLEAWYEDAPADVSVPMLNSVTTHTMDNILPLCEKYPFKVIALLVGEQDSAGGGIDGADKLHEMARRIFDAATGTYGFQPDDLFFDTTVFPLAIDMPMMPGTCGYTYRAFETIRMIMNDPDMKGVHTSLGVSNCVKDLPGRKIGVCRAYLAKAVEYGLDTAIVNVMHDYGLKPTASDLMELVEAFARQDGSSETSQKAMELMGLFCQACRKSK